MVLFGEHGSSLSFAEKAKVGLEGFFFSKGAGKVSGVIAATELAPHRVARHAPLFWHNPTATHPLTSALPFSMVVWDPDKAQPVESTSAGPIHQLLGLPEGWPGPDDPFPDEA